MTDYKLFVSKEQKEEAISAASSVEELTAMWAAWAGSGWSAEGMLYTKLLARMQALGAELSPGDLARVEGAQAKKEAGEALPGISGDLTLGRK